MCPGYEKKPQNSAGIFLLFIGPGITWEDHSQKEGRGHIALGHNVS